MSLVGALTKALKAGETAKKTAPFYSAVDEALANIARPKGTGAEFLTELSKQAGVKKAELADRKLEQAFKAKGKITKEEAQQILKENPPPKLQERQLTEISDAEREEALRDKMERTGYESWDEVPRRVMRKWNDEIDHDLEKFGDYKLPGGQNYREILLKLPKLDTANGDKNYWSTHFLQDPNVLAHMRVQDRVGPNGEKILHVEEIQSDWHQTGRKKGYKPEDYIEQSNALDKEFNDLGDRRAQLLKQAELIPTHGPEFTSLIDEANSITPKLMRLQEQRDNLQNVINYGVPDAPFKKNWHELAMKRLLNYAADKGYDSIAITPGSEQAKRYPRQVETEKIAQEQGMKGFYDKMLPDYLNSFGKPYGAQVQQHNIPVSTRDPLSTSWGGGQGEHPFITVQDLNEPFEGMVDLMRRHPETGEEILVGRMTRPESERVMARELQKLDTVNQAKLHTFPITPEMREAIKQKGLPLYQQVGIPTVGAGAASQVPEETDSNFATGGSVSSPIDYSKSRFFNPADPFAAGRALNAAYQSTGLPAMDRYGGRYAYELSTEAGRKAFGDAVNRVSKNTGEYGIYKPTDLNELAGAEISNPNTKNIYANLFTNGNSYFIPDYLEADPYQYNYHLDQTASGRTREQQNADFDRMYGGQMIANNAASALGRVYENGMGDQESIMRDFLKKKEDPNYGLPTVNNVGQGRDAAMKELYNNYGSQLAAFDVGRGDLTYDQGSAISKALEYQKYLDNQNMVVNQRTQGLKNIQNELANLTVNNGNTDTYNQMKAALEGRIQSEQANLDFAKKAQAMYQSTLDPYLQTVGGIENRDKLSSVDVLNMLSPVKQMANGGAVNYNTAPDMSDGGRIMQGAPFKHGGKVKVTTNRDAMFMELSNKKLKRK